MNKLAKERFIPFDVFNKIRKRNKRGGDVRESLKSDTKMTYI